MILLSADEQGPAGDGIFDDGAWPSARAQHDMVAAVLWGTFMGGGMGVEAYFGGGPNGDLVCESWRTRSQWWRFAKIAVDFFRTLPFWEMVRQVSAGFSFFLSL